MKSFSDTTYQVMEAYTFDNWKFVASKNKIHNDQPIYNKNHMVINHYKNLTLLEHMVAAYMEKHPMDELLKGRAF